MRGKSTIYTLFGRFNNGIFAWENYKSFIMSDKGYENWAWYSRAMTTTKALSQWKRSPGHNTLMINAGQWGRIQWRGVGASILGGHAVLWFGD